MKNKKIYQICEISKFGLHLASLPQKKTFSVPIYNHKDEHLAKKKKVHYNWMYMYNTFFSLKFWNVVLVELKLSLKP
jgi:hypothetical protein